MLPCMHDDWPLSLLPSSGKASFPTLESELGPVDRFVQRNKSWMQVLKRPLHLALPSTCAGNPLPPCEKPGLVFWEVGAQGKKH